MICQLEKGITNADRLKANEVGFQDLANYVSKNPRGDKRWMQSKNLYHPEANINDYRFSNKRAWNIKKGSDKMQVYLFILVVGFAIGYAAHKMVAWIFEE